MGCFQVLFNWILSSLLEAELSEERCCFCLFVFIFLQPLALKPIHLYGDSFSISREDEGIKGTEVS